MYYPRVNVYVCTCRTVINPEPHPELGYYMEVFALDNIPAYDELLARYGEGYWTPGDSDTPIPDPHKLTPAEFEFHMTKYFEALSTKFPALD